MMKQNMFSWTLRTHANLNTSPRDSRVPYDVTSPFVLVVVEMMLL